MCLENAEASNTHTVTLYSKHELNIWLKVQTTLSFCGFLKYLSVSEKATAINQHGIDIFPTPAGNIPSFSFWRFAAFRII